MQHLQAAVSRLRAACETHCPLRSIQTRHTNMHTNQGKAFNLISEARHQVNVELQRFKGPDTFPQSG